MKMPRSFLRMTACHNVVASPEPWIRSQGRSGAPSGPGGTRASTSCVCVAI